ncbi:type VI secretion system baseplate subunit TssE [Polyangium aurulentum]|uniref:type VI secretion system baseplate subunit TssE n=1 Tax=Polyangium aurulentum TaxID=2567896 RepID=UPI0010AE489A|nr:type VI secretion system baseplate subunit TssE [Polyangium aurulentum]UQA55631.1 type VI secretion system baseplate subunit TssE [Polyangium aurulentum]
MAASLLTRIAHAADPHSLERHTWKDQDLEQAVIAHLGRMLNTRQGSSLTCPDYGLIEVSEVLHDFPDAVGIVQRAIKNSIQQYEPRLKNVQVRHVKNEAMGSMVLEFEITGQIHYPDGRRSGLRFSTAVDQSGNVKVG